jgi:flagellar hook protein FlgE
MGSYAIPLSGLNASQAALQSISANLANVDTDGFKDQNVTFSDVFAQAGASNGALDPLQTGQGVSTASTTSNFTNGSVTSTGIPSNMALSGDGFFVVQQTNGSVAYSRAGDFTTSSKGQLTAPDGSLVLGYPAVGGTVQTSAALQPMNVGAGLLSPATATSSFSATTNLNATAPLGTTVPATINMYDSLGAPHVLTVDYIKTGTNAWSYNMSVPTADTGAASATVASGNLTFDSTGALTSPTGTVTGIAVPGFTDGAAAMNLTWNLNDTSGNSTLTQTDLASATSNAVQNGQAAGSLSGYTVEADGTIQGKFTNGTSQALGQVAVATVTNDQGLQQISNNLFQVTSGSGQAAVGIAGTGSRGTITGGSVEGSNVNEASEFSKMIVAQQAYQANAKSVTTFNQIAQATLAMLSA